MHFEKQGVLWKFLNIDDEGSLANYPKTVICMLYRFRKPVKEEDVREQTLISAATDSGTQTDRQTDRQEAMGKVPVRLKEVVYTLSPNQVHVMGGLFKDIPHKISEKISRSWLNSIFLLAPLVGTYWLVCHIYRHTERSFVFM